MCNHILVLLILAGFAVEFSVRGPPFCRHNVLLTMSFAMWLPACQSLILLATECGAMREVALVLCWVVTAFDEADGPGRRADIFVVCVQLLRFEHVVGLYGHLLL